MSFSDTLFNFLHDNKGLPFRSMAVFNFLLEASLCGALLIMLALLARWLLRRKLGNRLISLVWLLVAIRLLAPVALPNPLMNDLRPTLSTDAEARPIADQIRVRFQDGMAGLSRLIDQDSGRRGSEDVPAKISRAVFDVGVYTSYGWTGKWFLFTYFTVDGIVLCILIVQNARYRRRLKKHRTGQLAGEKWEKYQELCKTCKVKPLPVYIVDSLPGACLVGVIRPYIALPAALADPSQALAHELCHYKAHDEWWNVLRNLCCIAHWFNPLVWVGACCARADREYACDERVREAMTADQRVACAEAFKQNIAEKSAPGILILSTMSAMRNKRRQPRVRNFQITANPSKWGVTAFAILSVLVMLASFFTAESYSRDYNLALHKAIYMNQLDSPFPEVDEVFSRVPVAVKPIASVSDAIAQANLYLNTSFLGNVADQRTDLRYSVYHATEGWYVAATSSFDEAYCFLMGEDGRLLRYNSRLYDDDVLVNDGRLPSNMDEAMEGYMEAFAVDCLGQTGIANPSINEDQYDLGHRYLACQADIGGQTCGFLFCVAPYPRLMQFYTHVTPSVMVTQENVLYSLWVYQRDTLGITAEERKNGCDLAVKWLPDSSRWLGTMRIQANAVSQASLDKLQSLFGEREVYTIQMVCDAKGVESDAVTAIPVNVERDASAPVTLKATSVYDDVNRQQLYEEEMIAAGTPYTVLRTLSPEESSFEQEWAKGHTWMLVSYPSPFYDGEMERWMLSPGEVIALQPSVELDPDGRPVGWRSTVLPDAFWDTMEQMGGDQWATASTLLENWRAQNGESIATWPLEGQALWGLWMSGIVDSVEISGLPETGDVPMEKALELARTAFESAWATTYPGEAVPDGLKTLVSFLYDRDAGYRRIWYMQYIDPSRETGECCGDTILDAQTGEVLNSVAAVGGNG